MNKFDYFLARMLARFGSAFNAKYLELRFVEAYNRDQRIRVRFGDEIKSGFVTAVPCPCPVFALETSGINGAFYSLGSRNEIVAIKHGSKYKPIEVTK